MYLCLNGVYEILFFEILLKNPYGAKAIIHGFLANFE